MIKKYINEHHLDKLYGEYLVWLKQTHDITPDEKLMGLTTFDTTKKQIENSKLMILTFEEYKNSKI